MKDTTQIAIATIACMIFFIIVGYIFFDDINKSENEYINNIKNNCSEVNGSFSYNHGSPSCFGYDSEGYIYEWKFNINGRPYKQR